MSNEFYQRKKQEAHAAYMAAVETGDEAAQAHWLREYENYERMEKICNQN